MDIFINYSDPSSEYEREEYEAINSKLSPRSLILGDNSHVTIELDQFARERNRNFFAEKPVDHWYPGAGIGISSYQITVGNSIFSFNTSTSRERADFASCGAGSRRRLSRGSSQ